MLNLKHNVAQKGALRKQAGFTLIELLIVIAIIAILAAIAIPQFLKYKQGAYIDSMRSDVKNTVTAIEAYSSQNGGYPSITSATCGPGPASCAIGSSGFTNSTGNANGDINVSRGNTITVSFKSCGGTGTAKNGYTVEATSTQVSTTVSYDSCTGQYSGF